MRKKMQLNEYIEKTGIAKRKFARRAGVAPTIIHNIYNGGDIKLSTAMAICISTEMRVTPTELHREILSNAERLSHSHNEMT